MSATLNTGKVHERQVDEVHHVALREAVDRVAQRRPPPPAPRPTACASEARTGREHEQVERHEHRGTPQCDITPSNERRVAEHAPGHARVVHQAEAHEPEERPRRPPRPGRTSPSKYAFRRSVSTRQPHQAATDAEHRSVCACGATRPVRGRRRRLRHPRPSTRRSSRQRPTPLPRSRWRRARRRSARTRDGWFGLPPSSR